jgi:hypothetical protein
VLNLDWTGLHLHVLLIVFFNQCSTFIVEINCHCRELWKPQHYWLYQKNFHDSNVFSEHPRLCVISMYFTLRVTLLTHVCDHSRPSSGGKVATDTSLTRKWPKLYRLGPWAGMNFLAQFLPFALNSFIKPVYKTGICFWITLEWTLFAKVGSNSAKAPAL